MNCGLLSHFIVVSSLSVVKYVLIVFLTCSSKECFGVMILQVLFRLSFPLDSFNATPTLEIASDQQIKGLLQIEYCNVKTLDDEDLRKGRGSLFVVYNF